jgi:transposase
VLGRTAQRYISAEFVAFLTDIVINQCDKEIHVNVVNLSAHNSESINNSPEALLKVHPRFTPTYSSWFNQVELWLGKIECHVIALGYSLRSPT